MEMTIHGGTIVTANARSEILTGHSIQIENDRITGLIRDADTAHADSDGDIDAEGLVIIPGFIQTHVHLCQTLFRGLADDLELLDWLQQKIFPLEAAHSESSLYASAMIGIMELIRSGTTTILDMGTIRHEEEVIRAAGETGIRAFVGKAMMDVNDAFPALRESTKDSLASTRALAERWHNSYGGRIKYAVAPRYVLSCSETLLREANEMALSFDGMLFHTHASENKNEIRAVRERCKMDNIEYLHHLGVLSERACLAHCIHVSDNEISHLERTRTNISHCPSSNLKLGSGIANIPLFLRRGINVTLGADGAPCNNSLNMFREMHLAALLQKPFHGPTAMPAKTVFEMATNGGAKALGIEGEIGSIEVGKKADIVLLNLERVWNPLKTDASIYSALVYSASPENVDSVMIDGKWVFRAGELAAIDEDGFRQRAQKELHGLLNRL